MHYGYWPIERLKLRGEWIQSESRVLPSRDISLSLRTVNREIQEARP